MDADAEVVVAACSTHDQPCYDGAEQDADGVGNEAKAGLGGGEAFNLEVDRAVEENGEVGHAAEPICHASSEDGAVQHEMKRDYGFGGVVFLHVNEDGKEEEGQGQRYENKGMSPWDDVTS